MAHTFAAEGDGGIRSAADIGQDLVASDDLKGVGTRHDARAADAPTSTPTAPSVNDAAPVSSPKVTAIPPLVETPVATPNATPVSQPVSIPPVKPSDPPRYLTGWGVSVPKGIDHGRVTGTGLRLRSGACAAQATAA